MLHQLITEEFEPNADVRKHLVGAYRRWIGPRPRETVRGDFDEVPICTKDGETGCIVTWSTFRSTAPPQENSFFGRPGPDGTVAACVNPAAVGGGSGDLDAYMPSNSDASILSSLGTTAVGRGWLDPSAGAPTPRSSACPGCQMAPDDRRLPLPAATVNPMP